MRKSFQFVGGWGGGKILVAFPMGGSTAELSKKEGSVAPEIG